MKIKKAIFALLIIIMVFSGCAADDNTETYSLDNSLVGEIYQMKSDFINTKTVTMYFPDLTSSSLLRIVKEVNIVQGGSEIYAIASKLLSSTVTEEDNYKVPFNGEINMDKITVSRNLAIVNLTGDFTKFSEKEFFNGIIAVVNTLCELKSIDYVEIMINGRQMQNRGLLVNPMTTMDESLHLIYLDHINIIEDDERRLSKDKNILYFLDKNSNFLIAEITNISVSRENAADDLFKLLKNEPYYGSGMQSCVPQNALIASSSITSPPEVDGSVLTIRLESPKYETMDNKTRYMMCGGITLTLLSYYDNVAALQIFINGQPALEETLLTKEMFIANIGQIVTVFLPNRDLEYLIKIDFAMSQTRYNDPEERVKEIILADSDFKTNTSKITTENIVEDDILSVFVHDSCCVVNVSENLYDEISVLPYGNRKMFVYSVVNTLTAFENISSVQFLVEGRIGETFGKDIYIETPMLKNPGLVFE
ncbi:MAG: GerMN domain-containing protein [Clostridia bacterium]|nr:GerMN domain-containing protein [Clostridia bacterium]